MAPSVLVLGRAPTVPKPPLTSMCDGPRDLKTSPGLEAGRLPLKGSLPQSISITWNFLERQILGAAVCFHSLPGDPDGPDV